MRLLLLISLALTPFAQTAARTVQLRLLAFDSASVPAESYVFNPGNTSVTAGIEAPIKAYLNHESTVVEMTGETLVFTKSENAASLKDEGMRLAEVTLPKTGNQFLLIFLPNGSGAFRVLPVDDSVREFPPGSYRVINLSRTPVRITLEKKPYDLKPGQNSVITDPPVQANNHSAMTATAFEDGKPKHRIGSGLWPHPGRLRSVQILFDNPVTKQTELRGFRDIAPPRPGVADSNQASAP